MAKQTVVNTPHVVALHNGQIFKTVSHTISKNRMGDGVDMLYFETFDEVEPTGANHYHTWNRANADGGYSPPLRAWTIAAVDVSSVTKFN